MKKTEEEEILKDFDVTDREPNAARWFSWHIEIIMKSHEYNEMMAYMLRPRQSLQ